MQCYVFKLSFVQVIGAVFPPGVVSYLSSVDLLGPSHYHQHTVHTSTSHQSQLHVLSIWRSCSSCVPCVRINMWIRLEWLASQ